MDDDADGLAKRIEQDIKSSRPLPYLASFRQEFERHFNEVLAESDGRG